MCCLHVHGPCVLREGECCPLQQSCAASTQQEDCCTQIAAWGKVNRVLQEQRCCRNRSGSCCTTCVVAHVLPCATGKRARLSVATDRPGWCLVEEVRFQAPKHAGAIIGVRPESRAHLLLNPENTRRRDLGRLAASQHESSRPSSSCESEAGRSAKGGACERSVFGELARSVGATHSPSNSKKATSPVMGDGASAHAEVRACKEMTAALEAELGLIRQVGGGEDEAYVGMQGECVCFVGVFGCKEVSAHMCAPLSWGSQA
eukprot:1160129-Pelagomonas_calceolata.AAC.5